MDMIFSRPKNAVTARADADGWFTPGRFALLLGAFVIAAFPGVVLGTDTFFYRDFASFSYPVAFYHRESFWRGEFPLWDPFNNCGIPFLAQWNTGTLYPPSLFYLLLPLSWSLGVFCLFHLFLAGLGMYFLAHHWTGARLAAAIAGVTFAFNGLTWHCLMWPSNIAALGWMPWVLLTMERAWRDGGWRVALAGIIGALQMLAGSPEVVILTWCIAGAVWLAQFVPGNVSRGRMSGRMLVVLAIVAGLSAAQLLPFLDLLAHSQRDPNFGTSHWAMPLSGFANYLAPLFHTRANAQGVFAQYEQRWISSYYVGASTVALALLAVWRGGDRRVWALVGLAGFGLTMALGTNGFLYPGVKRIIPQIGLMRYPAKFLVLPTFIFPALAARAVAGIHAMSREKWNQERKKLPVPALLLLGLMAGIAWLAWKFPRAGDDVPLTLKNILVRAAFLLAVLGCLWVWRETDDFRRKRAAGICLLLLLLLDVFTHAPQIQPVVNRRVYLPDAVRRRFNWNATLWPGESRAMETGQAYMQIQYGYSPIAENDCIGRRLALFADFNLLDHLAKVDGFFSVHLREENDLHLRMLNLTNIPGPLQDLLGVSETSDPDDPGKWVRRDSFMPMITAGQEPVFVDDATALKGVTDLNFNPRRFVYLPSDSRPGINATRSPEANILSAQVAAHQIDAEVETLTPAMIVVSQTFYHPWHAYVDGRAAPLFRANYAFQAVQVPSGRHQVKWVYEDRFFRWGLVISIATLLGCGLGL